MEFKQWCKQKTIIEQNTEQSTHLMLDGGKLSIKDTKQFHKDYSKFLKNNLDVYVVERVSEDIKFFIDIDFKSIEYNSDIIIHIQTILPIKCFVYECSDHCGFHMIFNEVVNVHHAPEMLEKLVNKLQHQYGYEMNILHKMLDSSVYNTGLRMIGSYKRNETRCYLPFQKLRHEITAIDVEQSSIRASNENKIHRKVNKIQTIYGSIQNNNRCRTSLEDELGKFNHKYNTINVKNITMVKDTFCITTDSKYCTNLDKEHRSTHIYFVVYKNKKIYQKCFCKCSTTEGRKYGLCSKYRSKPMNLSHRVFGELVNSFSTN